MRVIVRFGRFMTDSPTKHSRQRRYVSHWPCRISRFESSTSVLLRKLQR